MTTATISATTQKMIDFVKDIGIPVRFDSIEHTTFLPGIDIEYGGLLIDIEKLKYPGDILHEAGHLAVVPPDIRKKLHGNLDKDEDLKLSGELMAIPWSYAACLHLQIDPAVVFHNDGYKGGGENIIENFSEGRYFGVPMLQWIGLTYEPHKAAEHDGEPYPKMKKWLRE